MNFMSDANGSMRSQRFTAQEKTLISISKIDEAVPNNSRYSKLHGLLILIGRLVEPVTEKRSCDQ